MLFLDILKTKAKTRKVAIANALLLEPSDVAPVIVGCFLIDRFRSNLLSLDKTFKVIGKVKKSKLRVVYLGASPLLRPFCRFLVQNLAESRDL